MKVVKVNSQKSFNLKEVSGGKQNICYLGTNLGKVTLRGLSIDNALDSKRYNGVFELMAIMEEKLDKEIEYDINLSYIGLESIVKVFIEMQEKQHAIDFFTQNISPRNFFYLINDLDNQNIFHSSDKIYERFLSNAAELRALNEFYNEFGDVIDNSFKHNLSNIYVYTKREDLQDETKYGYLRNITDALNGNDKKEKVLSFNLINEYYTDKTKSHLSESSKEELFYKVQSINNNWSKIRKGTKPDEFFNLDALYELAIAK